MSLLINKQRWFWVGLFVIVLAAAVLRLHRLGDYQQLFNQDEMVMGYDAWSIWKTGHDQHGELFPVYFRSFNDYVPGVAMYITAPFVGLLGLNEAHTRLPFALFGIVTVFLTGLTGRRWFSPVAGLVAAALLTIDPWHLNYSRISFPTSLVPFFTIAALYTFTRMLDELEVSKRSGWVWLTLSAASFALLGGVYPTMKLESPLLLASCFLAAIYWLRKHPKVAVIWIVLVVVFASPFLIDQFTRWDLLQNRFVNVTAENQGDFLTLFWTRYAGHYNPGMLFFNGGYGNGIGLYPAGQGMLFWLHGFFWLAALVAFARGAARPRLPFNLAVLLGLWFLTFPVASSITAPSPHELRAINFLPLPELLGGYGAVYLYERLRARHWSLGYGWAAGTLALAGFFTAVFCHTYFGPLVMETAAAGDWVPANIGFRETLAAVVPQVERCDTLWIEPAAEMYIYYLFYLPYPPDQWQALKVEKNPGIWLHIKWAENLRFGVPWTWDEFPPVLPGCEDKPSKMFYLSLDDYAPAEFKEIYVVRSAPGRALWRSFVQDPAPESP